MTVTRWRNDDNNTERGLARAPFSPVFSDLLENFFGGLMNEPATNRIPAVNISETADDFRLELAAPGLEKNDFKINLENKVLTISVEKQQEEETRESNYTKREFSYTAFKRSFNLPDVADSENIRAEYNNGLLHLVIPKKEEAKMRTREIPIS